MFWIVCGMALSWLVVGLSIGLGGWLGFQLVHQNGRLLAHMAALEQRLGTATAPVLPPPALPPQPAAPPSLPLGSAAPAFELPDLNGARRSG